jgi:hypothetical protein
MLSDKADQFIVAAYVLGIIASFFAINFNTTLGLIYGLFIFGFALYSIIDNKTDFPIYKNNNWIIPVIIGVVTYIVFIIVSSFGLNLIFTNKVSFVALMSLLVNSTIPVLQNSAIVGFLAYGIFIPFVETIAFLKFFEFFGDRVLLIKGDYKLTGLKTWIGIIITSVGFALFHLTAKGISNFPALVLVAFMMVVSIALMVFVKEQRSAIFFHVSANSVAMLANVSQKISSLLTSI